MELDKNKLADDYMRDTNYIIIKDTDDLEDLEKQWNTFCSYMTNRQQRLSDDKSIEIYGLTNLRHYEQLKSKLETDLHKQVEDPEDEEEALTRIVQDPLPLVENTLDDEYRDDAAEEYNKMSGYDIIGKVTGSTPEDKLKDLEAEYRNYKDQPARYQRKADDESLRIYGMTAEERYRKLKSELTPKIDPESFVGECIEEYRQDFILESNQHKTTIKRLNDTPYFTPSELIDLGVHGRDNYYGVKADNDSLVNGVSVPTWFDTYKDICMDHIFEDYSKEWIETLNDLYSDYDKIKESGDEDAINARKQSILDLGWNPEVEFSQENRIKASKRVNDILDRTIPRDIFISMDNIPEIDEEISFNEFANSVEYQPVFLVLTKGKTPIISDGIKFVTKSEYSHASITFDPKLNEVYSFNMRQQNWGFIKENLSSFKDNFITVFAFFAENKVVKKLKATVYDFANHKTNFDLRIFMNKILHINRRPSKDQSQQVCSTFVDTVLKSGGINLVGDQKIPAPSDIYNGAKSQPNKIFEVYNGIAPKYNGKKVERQVEWLMKDQKTLSINEGTKDKKDMTKVDNLNFKYVYFASPQLYTDGINTDRPLFITPYKGIASIFTGAIELREIGVPKGSYNLRYDEWNLPKNKLKEPLKVVHMYIEGYPQFKETTMITDGYIYSIPFEKYKDNIYFYSWMSDGIEYLIHGVDRVEFDEVTKCKIKYIIKGMPSDNPKYGPYNESVEEPLTLNINEEKKPSHKPMYFYHVIDKNVKLDNKGLKSPEYMLKVEKNEELYLKMTNKYRNRLVSEDGWNIYPGKDPDELTADEIFDGINAFRKDSRGNNQIYMFRFPPTRDLGKNMAKTLEGKKVYVFDINDPYNQKYIHKINWGFEGSYTGNKELDKDWYQNISYEDYFSKYNDKGPILFAPLNHISIDPQRGYLPLSSLIPVKEVISESEEESFDESYVTESILPSGVTLRNATKDDVDNMFKWEMESIDKSLRDDPKIIKIIKKDVQESIKITKMIMYNNDTIGMLTTDRLNDGYWYIGEIYIVKEHRNKGIGSALLKEQISKHDKIKLQVSQSNHSAIKLYKSLGFEISEKNDKNKMYVMTLDKKDNTIKESFSIVNEQKKFPVEFDEDGNLIIYKCKMGNISYGDEIDDSSELLTMYKNTSNIEGAKYELSKLWFLIDSIEKKMNKRPDSKTYNELTKNRATAINIFKQNIEWVMKVDKTFNFAEYYHNTPFSDNSVKITNNTLKYSYKALKSFIMK